MMFSHSANTFCLVFASADINFPTEMQKELWHQFFYITNNFYGIFGDICFMFKMMLILDILVK